jgi:hypothetical protein
MARSIVKEIVLEEKKPPWQVIMSNAETNMSSCFCKHSAENTKVASVILRK